MGRFFCENTECGAAFGSKHSTARYCGRRCAAQANGNLSAGRVRTYTREMLLRIIRDLASDLGRVPAYRDLKRGLDGKRLPDGSTFALHFGSWTAAVAEAGLPPHRPRPPAESTPERRLVSVSLRFRVLQRDGFRCVYCGGTPSRGYVLHADHVRARADGGKTTLENLTTSCEQCNLGKSSQELEAPG
jgi:5-methylcytosine-specific restriction endonuclease McrA